MEIIIDAREAEFLDIVFARFLRRRYWQATHRPCRIKHEQLEKALKGGITHLEIRVNNILFPSTVKLSCSPFNKRKRRLPSLPIEIGEREGRYDPVFESIEQAVKLYGSETNFVFKYPVDKLLNFEPSPVDSLNQDWFYDLCKGEDGAIFLLLYFNIPLPGPGGETVSCGVKIPKGR